MRLLISDANILIDMEEGKLLTLMFQLRIQFSTPDILFEEELAEHHAHLLHMGLLLGELDAPALNYAFDLLQTVTGPSTNDCLALALARQEDCPLLTGDMRLRQTASEQGVEVLGTLWLVEEMVRQQVITIESAKRAYEMMKAAGRRLPWTEAFGRLANLS